MGRSLPDAAFMNGFAGPAVHLRPRLVLVPAIAGPFSCTFNQALAKLHHDVAELVPDS